MKSLYVDIDSAVGGFELKVNLSLVGTGILVVLGPSGSGKTTLLRHIAGLESPDKGFISSQSRVFFNSAQRLNLPPQRRHIGVVFQDYALFEHMSVRKNILYGLRDREDRQRVNYWLDKLELAGLSERLPAQLSGGQRQRVALARALVTQPDFLLMDEPFSAIDQSLREKIREDISDLIHDIGMPTVMVSHDINDARIMADHILVMDQGRVLQFGRRDEVLNNPNNTVVAKILGWRNILPLELFLRHGVFSEEQLRSTETVRSGCSVGIQTWHLRIAQQEQGALPVTIEDILDRGPVRELKCRIGDSGLPLYLDVPWSQPVPARGEKTWITVSPHHVHLLGPCGNEPVHGLSSGQIVFPSVHRFSGT